MKFPVYHPQGRDSLKVFPVYQPYQDKCRLVFIGLSEDKWTGSVNAKLEYIFQEGQNDSNPVPGVCSVSVGDVLFMGGGIYICEPASWRELTAKELYQYVNMDRNQQWKFAREFKKEKQDVK